MQIDKHDQLLYLAVGIMGACISAAVRPLGLDQSSTKKSNKTLADLGNNLVWLQEKSLEERYDVLELIGKGSIGEVAFARRFSKPFASAFVAHSYTRAALLQGCPLQLTSAYVPCGHGNFVICSCLQCR